MDPLRHHGDADATPGCSTSPSTSGARPRRLAARPARRRARRPRPLPDRRARRRGPRRRRRAARPPARRGAPPRGQRRGVRAAPGAAPAAGRGRAPRVHRAGGGAAGRRACRSCGCSPTPPTATGCGPPPSPPTRTSSSSATRPTRPPSCTPPPRCGRCARPGGSWSSTRRSPTPCPASRSRWPARTARPARVPQPHQDLGAGRAAGRLRPRRPGRCWPGSPRPGRRGRSPRSRWRRSPPAATPAAVAEAERGRRDAGAAAGRAGRRRSRRCRASRCSPGVRRSCCCGCPTGRASGSAHALRAAGHRGAARRHVPRPRPRPPAGRRAGRRAVAAAGRGAGRGARRRCGGMTHGSADAIAALEAAYPPALAADWDAVGLVCGDPAEPRRRRCSSPSIPVAETVDEALDGGAQLLVTHHPLLLRGVHGVGADTPKGALVHRLVRAGAALFTAHTNADAADPGVSDALADALGLTSRARWSPRRRAAARQDRHVRPDRARPSAPCTTRCAAAGAGNIGDYCALLVRHGGHRPVQAARRGAPDDRRGRAAGAGGRDPARDGAARAAAGPPSSPRCAPRTPTRSPRSTCFELARPARRRRASAGSARCPSPSRCAASPPGSPPRCPRRRGACAPRATPTGRSAGRGVRRRGRLRARRRARGGRRRLRHRRPAPPPGVGAPAAARRRPRSSTSRTGRRSGRGARRRPASCARRWAVASRSASRRGAPIPGRIGSTHMKADPAVQRRLLDLAEVDAELNRLAHRRRTLPEHAAADRGRDGGAHGQGRAGRGGDPGRRPGPRHPPARTRRRGRPRPRRPRPEDPRGLRRGRQAGDRPAARARDPRPPAERAGGRAAGDHGAARGRRHGRPARPAHARRGRAGHQASVAERRDTALADIDAGEAGRRRDREAVVANLPADLLAAYDRRRARGGTGAAPLRERRCGRAGWSWTGRRSPRCRGHRRTRWCTARSAGRSWCGRRSRACEVATVPCADAVSRHVTRASCRRTPRAPRGPARPGRPTRLLLLRHGQTELSIQRRYSGLGDPELTALGHDQAAGRGRRRPGRPRPARSPPC